MATTDTWYARKFGPDIPPLFGRPQPVNTDQPQYIPARMWLVMLDDNNSRVEALEIQVVPGELEVNPKSNWVTIPAIGRNNPFYHYTGGEDQITFVLDWYSTHQFREDVIEKCRWVESLAKSNAYYKAPPRVLLIFGNVFQYDTWIIESATYKLSLFDRERNMMPRQAYQTLVLNKVTEKNTTTEQIRYSNGKPIFSSIKQ